MCKISFDKLRTRILLYIVDSITKQATFFSLYNGSMFTYAPPTRFDLRFSLFGIPVRVHPLFWLIALLLGGRATNPVDIFIWIAAVFISILIHELGHALAMRYHGQRSQILLHSMGGLTIPEPVAWGTGWANVRLSPNQEIFITAAGPGMGFLFAAAILFIIRMFGGVVELTTLLGFIPIPVAGFLGGNETLNAFIGTMLFVNVVWGIFNLLPVYPLDGGQIARNIIIQYDPWNGTRKALWLSVIVGGIMALVGAVFFRSAYMALLFGLLAFQSYQTLNGGTGRGY
jgi:Zn-dependent protease